jgi:hypothetical protein
MGVTVGHGVMLGVTGDLVMVGHGVMEGARVGLR